MGSAEEIGQIRGIHYVISSSDISASIKFYQETLGFQEIFRKPDFVRYSIWGTFLDVTHRAVTKENQNLSVNSLNEPHIALEVDHNQYNHMKWLLARKDVTLLELSDSEGKNKMFFQDPDGNLIAIITE